MDGMAIPQSKALRSALANARVLPARTLERVGLRRTSVTPVRRTGFLRGYSVPDDLDRMAASEIYEMFEGRQSER